MCLHSPWQNYVCDGVTLWFVAELCDSGFVCLAAHQFLFQSNWYRNEESAEHRKGPFGELVSLQFWYDIPCQSRYSLFARTVRGRLFDVVPEQGLAKTDFHDLIIRIYGLLGHRLVLPGAVKCVDWAVFHGKSLAPPVQRNKYTQTMTFSISLSIMVV